MKIGFIGLGKLGKDVAEVLAEKHDVTGYDICPVILNTLDVDYEVKINSLENTCKDKDIVFVAVQTPHDPAYDGKEPTSHLPPKDFDYSYLTQAVNSVDNFVNKGTLIAVISTVLPGTIRKEIEPLVKIGILVLVDVELDVGGIGACQAGDVAAIEGAADLHIVEPQRFASREFSRAKPNLHL